jgi:predicted metal-dependent phosphoesterase TrpH
VAVAIKNNVSVISICDHATTDAYDRLLRACIENDIRCIPGVELGALWKDEGLHILAYNFDRDNEQMKTLLNKQYKSIECEYIVFNMSMDYPQMTLDEYRDFEYPKEKGGWKYLYYAVAKGVAKTYDEANKTIFNRYSAPNHLSVLDGFDLTEICATISQAKGVPVLAHPGDLYTKNSDRFVNLLNEIKELGIEGIECYYPSHTEDITNICVDFCKNNDLRITGGCDCHGDYDKSEGFTVGALDISLEMLDLKGII